MAYRQALRGLHALRPAVTGTSSALLRRTTACMAKRSFPAVTNLQPINMCNGLHTTVTRCNDNIFNIQDEDDFQKRVVQSATPVIVDFHAVWCGPCKMLGPRLESMVSEQDGKVLLAKVDIDDMGELAMNHGVQAVPTVIAMKEGKVVNSFVGMKDDDSLSSFISNLVK